MLVHSVTSSGSISGQQGIIYDVNWKQLSCTAPVVVDIFLLRATPGVPTPPGNKSRNFFFFPKLCKYSRQRRAKKKGFLFLNINFCWQCKEKKKKGRRGLFSLFIDNNGSCSPKIGSILAIEIVAGGYITFSSGTL